MAMVVFCFSTLTYSFWPPINRILAISIIAALGLNYVNKIRGKEVLLLLGMLCVFVCSLLTMEDTVQNVEDWLYWVITCMFLLLLGRKDFVARMAEETDSLRKFVLWIIILSNVVLVVGLNTPGCYINTRVGVYFQGFAYSEHSLCSASCLLLVLILLYYRGKRASIMQTLLMIIPSMAILDSGARTFLVPLIVIWVIYYVDFVKSKVTKMMLFPVAIGILLVVFANSSMLQKFINTSESVYISDDTMAAMSSGRLDFWKLDIEAYWDLNFFSKILGKGFDYVYKINMDGYGMRIWAHNDIIDLLLSAGLLGVTIYLVVFTSLVKNIYRMRHGGIKKFLLALFVILPMLLNGLFIYQHYLYSFVFLFVYYYWQGNTDLQKKINEPSSTRANNNDFEVKEC